MKPLSRHLTWLLLLLQCSPSAFAESEAWKKVAEAYRKADEEWTAAELANRDGKSDPARLDAAARVLRPLIKIKEAEGPPAMTVPESMRFMLMDWKIAEAWTAAGDHKKALQYLKAQAAQPGVFLHETRNPNYFARDVFMLHSEIMAGTGKVADIPHSGYQVFKGPSSEGVSRYVFVWEPEGDDIGGVLVQGMAEDEQRHEITLVECGPAKPCRCVDSAQVISKRGKLKASTASRSDQLVLVLDGVSKIVEFKGEFLIPFVHPSKRTKIELYMDEDDLEQPLEAIARMDHI
ncbi:hypothetical protein OKA05_25265 [Luteolibacter arcticus]|uniref:Uncharacterized protein n=1 Tax=Luteolibacter arcticus TaxID=1581411 RepID=A0ABT3GQU4_9BACT|nr:hypothetical protein [Luteolibacter arcticus]MCW1925894.1 hypothetical protein [Luteolibacter arcticus]